MISESESSDSIGLSMKADNVRQLKNRCTKGKIIVRNSSVTQRTPHRREHVSKRSFGSRMEDVDVSVI